MLEIEIRCLARRALAAFIRSFWLKCSQHQMGRPHLQLNRGGPKRLRGLFYDLSAWPKAQGANARRVSKSTFASPLFWRSALRSLVLWGTDPLHNDSADPIGFLWDLGQEKVQATPFAVPQPPAAVPWLCNLNKLGHNKESTVTVSPQVGWVIQDSEAEEQDMNTFIQIFKC